MPSIFLCHAHEDKTFVKRIAKDLNEFGIETWVDEAEMLIGESVIHKISEGIFNADFLVAVLSPHSVNSQWVKKEISMGMTLEIKGDRIKVLPLLLEDCELPLFLQDKLYADFRTESRYYVELSKLFKTLGLNVESELKFKSAIIQYDKHLGNILVHIRNTSKTNIDKNIRKIFREIPVLSIFQIANGMELAVRRGVNEDDLLHLLLTAGKVSVGLESDNEKTIVILHKIKSYFYDDYSFEQIGDKVVMTAQKGVPILELEEVFDHFSMECNIPQSVRMDEFLATTITLAKKEIRGRECGLDLASVYNSLNELR